MRRLRFVAVGSLLLSLVTFSRPCAAQQDSGSVSGVLRGPTGSGLAQIVLTLSGASVSRSVVTGPDGHFRVSDLPEGRYALSTSLPGLTLGTTGVEVSAGHESRVSPVLVAAALRENVLVTATRGDAALSTLGTSATVLDRARLDAIQPVTVLDVLREVPGVAVARTGGIGRQASAFVRGGEPRFARVLVDGIPINEPGGGINYGAMLPLEVERVEIVRGAASSLYASDALAGVVQFITRQAPADAPPDVRASVDGGSFGTWGLSGGTSGRKSGWDWNVGALRYETDNQKPNSHFAETAGALNLGRTLGESSQLRLVLRGDTSTGGTPGTTAFMRPDLDARYEQSDALAAAVLRTARAGLSHEWRVGASSTHQLTLNPEDSGPYAPRWGGVTGAAGSDWPNAAGFQNDTWRLTAAYQLEAQVARRQLLTAGVDLERETGSLGDRREPLLSPTRTNAGAYVQDRIVIGQRAFVMVGGRLERNDSYGWAAVPRAALAFRLRSGANATTLRASAGSGIKEPRLLESYGVSLFTKGNPELQPERSRTLDCGVEQRLAGGHVRVEATLFHQTYLDQIAYFIESYDPFVGTYKNLGKTRARGVELSLEAAPLRALRVSADYTYLDGEVVVSADASTAIYAVGRPLLRRPKHQASFAADGAIGRLSAGATLLLVGRRADSDFLGMGIEENGGYARLDARLRARLAPRLEVFVAGENLLDREYMEVLGYPALGRALRVGVRLAGAAPRVRR